MHLQARIRPIRNGIACSTRRDTGPSISDAAAAVPDFAARLAARGLHQTDAAHPGRLAATVPGWPEELSFAQQAFSHFGRGSANILRARQKMPRFVDLGFVGSLGDRAARLARRATATTFQAVRLRKHMGPGEMVLLMPAVGPQLTQRGRSRLSPWS